MVSIPDLFKPDLYPRYPDTSPYPVTYSIPESVLKLHPLLEVIQQYESSNNDPQEDS